MGRKSKYSEIQIQFILEHLNVKNVELKALFEEKFNAEIDRHYIANLRIRTRAKEEKDKKRFNLKIGDSYVNKDSKMSEEISAEVKENVDLFRGLAKRGIRRWNLERQLILILQMSVWSTFMTIQYIN